MIEKAIQFAVDIANDNSHGYDQLNRWGTDYDCSSLVISAWKNAGVPLSCTYTGNMKADMLANGFEIVTDGTRKAGDVLLNEANHTAMMIDSSRLVQASINELGTTRGGQPGDQTGREINISPYYNYPWDCVLRYTEAPQEKRPPDLSIPVVSVSNDFSEAVKALQALLNLRLSTSLEVDGYFGENTEAACRSAQKKYGLDVDGICGIFTWSALIRGN